MHFLGNVKKSVKKNYKECKKSAKKVQKNEKITWTKKVHKIVLQKVLRIVIYY